MIPGFAIGLLLAGSPQSPPAPSVPVLPSTSAPSPAVQVRGIDSKAFVRELDALGDVRPVTRTVLRTDAVIESVDLDLAIAGSAAKVRSVASGFAVVSPSASGSEVLLGELRWDAQSVTWSWRRTSATAHRAALDAASDALATCAIEVRQRGGAVVRLQPPAAQARVVLHPGSVTRVRAPVPAGKVPVFVVAPGDAWTRDDAEGRMVLGCDAGDLVVAWDGAAHECTLEWVSAVASEIEFLRKDLQDRRKELSKRNKTERAIIERELEGLQERIKDLEGRLGSAAFPPPVPPITLRSDAGRDYAVIEATMRKSSP